MKSFLILLPLLVGWAPDRCSGQPVEQDPRVQDCSDCLEFLSKYKEADDSKNAVRECKKNDTYKDVKRECKKVAKDVVGNNNKDNNEDRVQACKDHKWCFLLPTNAPTTRNPTKTPSVNPTIAPTGITASEPTANCNCDATMNPTGTPTSNPTSNPTNSPTEHPTLVPTDPKPDEKQCAVCMNFLSKYEDADDSKYAEKECKIMSCDKVVQKACKKVVKDVLKKRKDEVSTCKVYGWCF